MIRLTFSIALLVVLAVLVLFNARYSTSFSLFGFAVEEVPVIAVALLAFVLGVVYSFVFYVLRFLDKQRRVRLKQRGEHSRSRERALEDRQAPPTVVETAGGAAQSVGGGEAARARRRPTSR